MLVFQVFRRSSFQVSIKLAIHGSLEIEALGRPAQDRVVGYHCVPERRVGQNFNDDKMY